MTSLCLNLSFSVDIEGLKARLTARPTQTYADSIFFLAGLARENLHALRANSLFRLSP
jgi:hypothetical protein